MDPERERKAREFAIRRADELAAEWDETEKRLRQEAPSDMEMAGAFVNIIRRRVDVIIAGYIKHAIDEPYTKYDREFLARKAMEESGRLVEHVRERFGQAIADVYAVELESHAVDALKNFLDPV